MHGQGNLVSTSHEATAPSGKGDHRLFGPRGIREDQGHGSHPIHAVRSFGRGANSQGMASEHGRSRALLGMPPRYQSQAAQLESRFHHRLFFWRSTAMELADRAGARAFQAMVAMRDGTRLNTFVLLPESGGPRW